jgi:O-antigen/teichoic acid export membrane protein
VWRSLRPAGIGALSSDLLIAKSLIRQGTSFLILNLILYLQPTIDAYFLTDYASAEAIGWYAAARKLINPLVFPAGALIAALYPALCRLWTQDQSDYRRTARGALRAAIVITVPLAIGCAAFAEIGIRLFTKVSFGPATQNLRILAGYVLLVYITMILGTCLNAAGKQRAWTVVQFICIVVSVTADPVLVPWFQGHMNNGGLGVALATVASEVLMLAAGVLLLPRGIIDRSVLRSGLLATAAGGAMAGTAWLLSSISPFIAAPIAASAYGAALFAIGGLEREQLDTLRAFTKRGVRSPR